MRGGDGNKLRRVTYFLNNKGALAVPIGLTANSLGTYIETHGKPILRTLSYLTVNSQDDSHCELAVSFLG